MGQTMGQYTKVLLVIDNAHTVPKRALGYGQGIGGLSQDQSSHSLCLEYLWQVYQHLYKMYTSESE